VAVEALSILDSVLMGLLLLLLVVCGITDLVYQKIWNVVTFPAMGLGLLVNLSAVLIDPALGLQYALGSLSGLVLGFTIFFVIFLFGGMGGGDVKYVAAIGAMDPYHFGYAFILPVIFYSVLAGGAISIIAMTLKGRLFASLRNVFRSGLTFVAPGFEHEPLKPENSLTIPFGVGISFGTLWTLVLFEIGALPF
jgi:prepilin peptidase CpaA